MLISPEHAESPSEAILRDAELRASTEVRNAQSGSFKAEIVKQC